MWPPDEIVRQLRARDELCEVAPGVISLRGDVAALYHALERAIAGLCALESADDWRVPPAIDFATLVRADYFASFPQWLTLASHLSDDVGALQDVAASGDCHAALARAATAPQAALNPAVCYHVYSALAGTTVGSPTVVTAQSECWRHEGTRHRPLERCWAFTMREIVCVGTAADVRTFLDRSIERVTDLALALDLDGTIELATDPFFASTGRARRLLQQVKELKRELLLPVDANQRLAAASFNLHDTFFGDAFAITLTTGRPATSGCVAFGIERWLLAFLVRHGPAASAWPSIDSLVAREVQHG